MSHKPTHLDNGAVLNDYIFKELQSLRDVRVHSGRPFESLNDGLLQLGVAHPRWHQVGRLMHHKCLDALHKPTKYDIYIT